jgi:hypothetical protein
MAHFVVSQPDWLRHEGAASEACALGSAARWCAVETSRTTRFLAPVALLLAPGASCFRAGSRPCQQS